MMMLIVRTAFAVFVAAAVAQQAAAQAMPAGPARDEDGGEIVVTGFRQSIEDAQAIKRDSNVALDSIVASDIADFPDLNLAEAIQRVPGVAITRDAGEGRQISLRGLGPDFTRVRLNGMEALSTTASIDSRGGVNRSRSFDFNIFASDLFSRVDVRKSAAADVEEGGLAGTVDLFTAHPLDFATSRFALTGQGYYNTNSEKADPRVAGLVSLRNPGGTLGLLVSVAYSRRRVVEHGYSNVRWATGGWTLANVAASIDPAIRARLNSTGPDALFYPRFDRYDIFAYDQKRLGITSALQFRPSDTFEVTLDGLYGRFAQERREHHLDAVSFSRRVATGLGATTIRSLVVEGNDIVAGDFGRVDNRSDNQLNRSTTKFTQGVASLKWQPSPAMKVDGLFGHERSKFDNPVQDNLFFVSNDRDFGYDFRANDRVPLMTYGFDVRDPAQYRFDVLRRRSDYVGTRLWTGKLNAAFEANAAVTVKAGGIWTRQTNASESYQRDITTPLSGRLVNDISRQLPWRFGRGLGAPRGTPTGWLIADLDRGFAAVGADSYAVPLNQGGTYRITEEVAGGYAQLLLNGMLGTMPLRGDAGVRYAGTRLTSAGYVSGQWVTLRRRYGDWLPSANLVLEVQPDFLLRLNANRNITRPTLSALAPNGSVNSLNRTVSSGNPDLAPFRAGSIDLSAEWYLGRRSLIQVAAFHKSIDSFIVGTNTNLRYDQSGLPLSLLNLAVVTPDQDFLFTRPVNGTGARLNGVEVIANIGFDFLPAPWDGFGVLANYTRADSDIDVDVGGGAITRTTLPGLSRNSANGTLYYETKGFSARVSVNYRDRYITAVPGGNGNDVAGTNATTNVDASVRYDVTPHFAVTVEAINLTNQADDQFVNSTNRVYNYTRSGRQFIAGVRLDF